MSIKILTVDDSKTIRLIVTKAFKSFDCTILEAANGVVGLAIASREKPDVILLDYTMPVMDGLEVLARLRSVSGIEGDSGDHVDRRRLDGTRWSRLPSWACATTSSNRSRKSF